VYVLEEVLEAKALGDKRSGQTSLELALNDFTFTFERILDQLKPVKH
jgi:hypothetical protein